MREASGNQTSAAEAAALADIRRAAAGTLAAWPEARAAVLFGSRARGDHLPSSDWDVAFITRGGDRVTAVPAGLPIVTLPLDVQALAVPEDLARRKALSIGHVGRGIVRDGRLLAGHWSRPDLKGEPAMEPDRYTRFIVNAAIDIRNAATEAASVGKAGDWSGAFILADRFVVHSSGAAEHLAKAMLGRRGIDPEPSHELDLLAGQAEGRGHAELAAAVRGMDGFTHRDHVAVYNATDTDGVHHAARRLPIVIGRMEEELASAFRDPEFADGPTRMANQVTEFLTTAEDTLRLASLRDLADQTPPPGHEWLAPLIDIRLALPPALSRLVGTLRRLAVPEQDRDHGAWRSPSPFD